MTVLAAHNWASNAELIADVAKLGYLDGYVYDCTYGLGNFWKVWQPEDFFASDLHTGGVPGVAKIDFTAMPWNTETWDAVVFDPPYKLNGTSRPQDAATDAPYGVAGPYVPAAARHQLMRDGLTECARVTRAYVLVKCQPQVCSGRMHWQDLMMIDHAKSLGRDRYGWRTYSLELVDRFDLLGKHRPQPMEGRKQKHAHGRPSCLLVFRKSA